MLQDQRSYSGRNLTGKGFGLGLFLKINLVQFKHDLIHIKFRQIFQGHTYYYYHTHTKKVWTTTPEKAT